MRFDAAAGRATAAVHFSRGDIRSRQRAAGAPALRRERRVGATGRRRGATAPAGGGVGQASAELAARPGPRALGAPGGVRVCPRAADGCLARAARPGC